jgi:predicted nucleotidyltransferase
MTILPEAVPVELVTREEAARIAEKCAQVLVEEFGARRVIPYGSVTGDAPWHSRSDIDLAVEGLPPELEAKAWAALERLLPPGLEVDLIALESAPPELRARILGEVRMPKETNAALKLEIETELKNLERIAAQVARFLASAHDEPDSFMVAGVAKYLHDFYNGVERVFERIAVRVDGGLPSGDFWHTQLLEHMAAPLGEERPAVIDPSLQSRLLEFLRFRHRIRHTYSYELEWPRVKRLAEELDEVTQRVRAALEAFEANLDQAAGKRKKR